MPSDRLGAELLETAFLGEPARLTRTQVEEGAEEIPAERTRELWRALGFVDPDPDQPYFTEADVEALRVAQRLAGDPMIGPGVTASVTRTVGQAMSRLAEAQTQIVSEQLAADPALAELARTDPDELVRQVGDRFAHVLPDLEWVIAYTWRRHMLAAVQRALGGAARDLTDHTAAVGFCDIVGYTTAVREMTSEDLSQLVGRFEEVASDLIVAADGRVVKTLGDEVMFLHTDPVRAAELALKLAEAFGDADGRVPPVRVGLAYGPTLAHAGDVFGPVVNIASRCTGLARPGTVVCDRELAAELERRPAPGLRVTRLRTARVRGYAHLMPYAIRRAD